MFLRVFFMSANEILHEQKIEYIQTLKKNY